MRIAAVFSTALGVYAAALCATTALADTSMQCKVTTPADIEGLFDRWNTSLKTLKPDEVVKNYDNNAVLLPTVSNVPRLTQGERLDYFAHFLEDKPVGKIDMRVIKIGCNDAIDTGLYTFTFGNGKQVQARYTFTYVFKDDRWLISTHHSSMMPEPTK